MNIFLKAFYFLPAALCMYWILALLFSKRNVRENVFMTILILFEPYFVSYAFFCMPGTDYLLIAQFERIGLPSAFTSLGLLVIYFVIRQTGKKPSLVAMMFMAPGLMYGAMLNTIYFVVGIKSGANFMFVQDTSKALPKWYDNSLYETFEFVDRKLPMYIGGIFILIIICQCSHILYTRGYKFGNFTKFMFMGFKADQSRMIALFCTILLITFIPVDVLGPKYMTAHAGVSFVLTVVISFILYVICAAEFHNDIEVFTLRNVLNSKVYYRKKLEEAQLMTAMRQQIETEEAVELERSYKERRRMEILMQFRRLMETEELYRDSDINIITVADKLKVGRTTLSAIINQAFEKNFRSVINDYRIEYAKKYLKDNPNYSLEQIAFQSGFKDASAFSHKFKELVGKPPLTWLISQGES